jgi:1-phosphatidylinositol-4-phosphate 5-kinase
MTLEKNKKQIFKTNSNEDHGNGGKSGSFFFFTEDKEFIIKSMTTKELKNLMKILPMMTKFLQEKEGKSLISRIYGVYQIMYPGIASINLMIQKNNVRP